MAPKKKYILIFCILSIFIIALAFIKYNSFNSSILSNIQDTIDVQEFYSLSQKPNTVILDIRTPAEYDEDHLIGSILINFYSPDFKSEIQKLDKDKTYLIHCRTDRRSGHTIKLMRELGFQNVYFLKGGILAWKQNGKPTFKEPNK
jgi:rhodanese-related sulfurtransferase